MDILQKKILHMIKQADPLNPLAYAHEVVKDFAREKMDSYISQCNECPLSCHTKSLSKGRTDSSLMIIGEMLTSEQASSGEKFPLEGTEGYSMLLKVLDHYHVDHEKLFYMNAVNCFPHKEIDGKILPRTPTKGEIEACKVFLDYAIDIVRPKAIILLGPIALNAFKKEAFTKARGEWMEVRGIPALPTYNPDYFVQVQGVKSDDIIEELKIDFCDDIEKALLYMQENHASENLLKQKIQMDY